MLERNQDRALRWLVSCADTQFGKCTQTIFEAKHFERKIVRIRVMGLTVELTVNDNVTTIVYTQPKNN